jgi:hypothetical protein
MNWFGYKDRHHSVPTPVGQPCLWCEEPIQEGDKGVTMPHYGTDTCGGVKEMPHHIECMLRQTVGSVGHQNGTCWCFNKINPVDDPPGMTKRQAAIAAYKLFQERKRHE